MKPETYTMYFTHLALTSGVIKHEGCAIEEWHGKLYAFPPRGTRYQFSQKIGTNAFYTEEAARAAVAKKIEAKIRQAQKQMEKLQKLQETGVALVSYDAKGDRT